MEGMCRTTVERKEVDDRHGIGVLCTAGLVLTAAAASFQPSMPIATLSGGSFDVCLVKRDEDPCRPNTVM